MESFWGSMQTELLNRKKWMTGHRDGRLHCELLLRERAVRLAGEDQFVRHIHVITLRPAYGRIAIWESENQPLTC